MDQEQKEQIAQEKYDKPYSELSSNEQKAVGGTFGGNKRKEEMAAEHGSDVHAAYSEMGSTQRKGGEGEQQGEQE